ncbi:MAG: hypothetical protein HFE79_09830 [Ruminiclostridium sp.]|nr:hypothetical protein [Ruminiclostridium sp.]
MYRTEPLFPYADGYYGIFPRGMENRDIGKGSIVIESEYIIYFKPETPDDIKQRLIKDYAEYHKKEKESGVFH